MSEGISEPAPNIVIIESTKIIVDDQRTLEVVGERRSNKERVGSC